jgi:hypothetical protein
VKSQRATKAWRDASAQEFQGLGPLIDGKYVPAPTQQFERVGARTAPELDGEPLPSNVSFPGELVEGPEE